MVVCLSRDTVLVNGAACRLLMEAIVASAENQLRIIHTLNNVGKRLSFDVLQE